MSSGKVWLTPEQVAERLGFKRAWVYQQLRSGALRGSFVGGRWFIPEEAIDEMMEAHSNVVTHRRRRRDVGGRD